MNSDPAPASKPRCPQCGGELASPSQAELCPKCLLQAGLSTLPSTGPNGTAVVAGPDRSIQPLPQPGEQFGHYRIVRKLGEGGMGVVFEAEDLDANRRVALKVLGHKLDSPEARARFLREGRLAASINHPNSVYVFGTEEIGGIPVIAMELALGGTLEDRVRAQGPFGVAAAVDALLQVMAGLDAAQQIGVLHRDIKPSNCFIDTTGTVKIGDFGLSISKDVRPEPSLTASGVFLGTPAYSSPEQIRGDELTVRSDIYSTGVTLYYLLTGRLPFTGANQAQLLAAALERRAESPAKLRPEIPDELAAAVLRCLEKNPAKRFQTYADLRQALLSFSSLLPAPAPLSLRFCAGALDSLALGMVVGAPLSILILLMRMHGGTGMTSAQQFPNLMKEHALLIGFLGSLLSLTYYWLFEGWRGASPGKMACKLQVIRTDNRGRPGLARAFLRAAIFLFATTLISQAVFYFSGVNKLPAQTGAAQPAKVEWTFGKAAQTGAAGSIRWVVLGALFLTARRRNGLAAIHDLLSGTRVICQAAPAPERPLVLTQEPPSPELAGQRQVGPYQVIKPLEETGIGMDPHRHLRSHPKLDCPTGTLSSSDEDLRSLGGDERNSPKEKVLGGPSERARASHWAGVRSRVFAQHQPSTSGCINSERWLLGYDLRLLRQVWIRLLPPNAPAMSPALRQISRFGRVHWLNSGRTATESWDAFECPSGQPLTALLDRQHPWNTVRFWLLDVAEELAAATQDGSLPERLALDRVWITADGRAKLLDFAPPSAQSPHEAGENHPASSPQGFLRQLAAAGLEGRQATDDEAAANAPRLPLAVPVQDFLSALNSTLMLPEIIARLRALTTSDRVTRRQRFALAVRSGCIAGGTAGFLLLFALLVSWGDHIQAHKIAPVVHTEKHAFFEDPSGFVLLAMGFSLGIGLLPSLLAALLFQGGFVMRAMNLAVVRQDGSPASRGLMAWRLVVAWSPMLLGLGCVLLLAPVAGMTGCLLGFLIIISGLGLVSALLPDRGLHDRLAGTCLVPRR